MRNVPELAERGDYRLQYAGSARQDDCRAYDGMLVFLTRPVRTALQSANSGNEWGVRRARGLVGLVGLKMGIVGLGNIGRQIAKRAAAFEMEVSAVDVNSMEKPDYVSDLQLMDGMAALLRESDVVVVTVPDHCGDAGHDRAGLSWPC